MLPLLLIGAVGFGWAWATGRLRGLLVEDGAAALAAVAGLRLLYGGQLLPAVLLLGGAAVWVATRLGELRGVEPMTAEDARAVLGVRAGATRLEIAQAHRRLIARVHPDHGGSAELAARVNLARDTLLAEASRRTPARG